jgi:ADP-heptose:LPS heptosyltransferase
LRLLVLRALGLGDLLTGLPALRALGDAFPDHRRVLATSAGVAPLALHAGAAEEVLATEPVGPSGPGSGGTAPLAWKGPPPELAVNLHGRGPQSHRILQATAPRRLVAFANAAAGVSGPRWREDEHEVQRWCRLLHECEIPADPTRLDLEPPDGVEVPAHVNGATLLHPGAASPARCWPVERWSAVARAEAGAGRTVVISGGPGEVHLARAAAAGAGLSSPARFA